MSDYVHEKVVRLPFPKELIEKYNVEDTWDCEIYLKEKVGDLWDIRDKNSVKRGDSDAGYYIDGCYDHTYGDESGDYGSARLLTNKEIQVITPYFKNLGVTYEIKDLRVVD